MKTTALLHGTIELIPYADQGEFVIVGVFAVDPGGRTLHWRLQKPAKTTRLAGFFPELDRRQFRETLRHLNEEWIELGAQINQGRGTRTLELAEMDGGLLFQTLTQPRGGNLRYQARGTVIEADIEGWLDRRFNKLVLREIEMSEAPEEKQLTDEVRRQLCEWNVVKTWKEAVVGPEAYHARFPFAYRKGPEEPVLRAIKPLYLAGSTPVHILEHGDAWLQKIRRLRHFGEAPNVLVFPLAFPANKNTPHYENASLVAHDLRHEGVEVLDATQLAELKRHVLTVETEDLILSGDGRKLTA
ncbi:MAG: DUF3037 domain-containing protein [Verrucomicrobiota bacterium]